MLLNGQCLFFSKRFLLLYLSLYLQGIILVSSGYNHCRMVVVGTHIIILYLYYTMQTDQFRSFGRNIIYTAIDRFGIWPSGEIRDRISRFVRISLFYLVNNNNIILFNTCFPSHPNKWQRTRPSWVQRI